MTSEELLKSLMDDVDYILNNGFVINTESFLQTMCYATEQYKQLEQRIAELEAPKTCETCKDYKPCTIYDYAGTNPTTFSCCYYEPKDEE